MSHNLFIDNLFVFDFNNNSLILYILGITIIGITLITFKLFIERLNLLLKLSVGLATGAAVGNSRDDREERKKRRT